jgi:hypothetical protein
MRIRLALLVILLSVGCNSAWAETTLMKGYEQLRSRSEVSLKKEKRQVRNLMALVSYQVGLVSFSPILARDSITDSDMKPRTPRLGLTVTVPLGVSARTGS